MKRISFLLAAVTLLAVPAVRAQDAATEERLNKLSGQIDTLLEGQQVLTRRIEAVAKELESVREMANKPTGNYADQQDLKRLAEAVKEIDRKRLDDYEKIGTQLRKLGKELAVTPPVKVSPRSTPSDDTPAPARDQKGFEYVVQSGDSLSAIVQAYREKNIKVSMEQVLKANPGLKPERLRVGQKVWIPAP